jgi:CHAT domain-containing protein/Flp pilus assembly protein TadD
MVNGALPSNGVGRLLAMSFSARKSFFQPLHLVVLRLALCPFLLMLSSCPVNARGLRVSDKGGGINRRAPSLQPSRLTPLEILKPRATRLKPLLRFRINEQPARDSAANAAQAETLEKDAQTLAAKWTEASLRQALEKYAAALSLWQSTGDARNVLRTLDAMGRIQISLSEYKAALAVYEEELKLSQDSSDKARALNGISSAYTYVGEQKRALVYCTRALQLSQGAGDYQGQAESLLNLGEIQYFSGEIQKAQRTFEEALSLYPHPDWRDKALTLVNLGYVHFDLRDMDKAIDHYEQALAQSRSQGDRRVEAFALTAIGAVNSYLGNKQTALDYQNQAVALFRTIGDRNGEGVALNGLGYVYRNLAEYQKSLECYLRAMQLFQVLGNREYENFTITRVGKAYQGLGDNAKALEYYRLALARAAHYSQTRAQALNSIGSVLAEMRQPAEALVHYRQSLALFRAVEDKMGEASLLNSIGEVYLSFGKRVEALNSYRQALSISRTVRDRRGEVSVLRNIAQTQFVNGEYNEARQTVETSLSIIESLRAEVGSANLRSSYFSSVREHYELYIDILMQLDKSQPEGRFAEKAFSVSEMARARSLLELLTEAQLDIRQGVDPLLLEQARELQQKLNIKAERHTQLIGSRTEEAAEIDHDISQLTDQYDQLEVQIKLKSPRYAALIQPQPLTLPQVQQQILDDNSILLEYMLGEQKSYLWAVTRAEVSTYELAGRAEIERTARSVYNLLTANQPQPGETFEQTQERIRLANVQLPAEVGNLSRLLLSPVASKLGTKRLLVIPDGALQYIPFQILTTVSQPSHVGSETVRRVESRPLLLDHEIVNEPSASTLALLISETTSRKQASRTVAVFADPVFEPDDSRISFPKPTGELATSQTPKTASQRSLPEMGSAKAGQGLPRLQASRQEADAIMSVTPWWSGFKAVDFEANRATAMKPNLSDYRIVHFATHAFLNDEHPELSGVVLSMFDQKGQPQDGFLRLHDIYNLKLPVDLVVLSACNTGLGKDVRGEGLIGLTRGFMYAGASGVVASLWKVDDDATAELMQYFYRFMLKDGLTPAAALRQAQITMSQQKRWQSPYYWAGFVIQGQYTQSERTSHFPIPHLALWLIAGAFLSAVAIYVLRRRRRIIV